MGALRVPKLLKLEIQASQIMFLYSKSATCLLSNLCYNRKRDIKFCQLSNSRLIRIFVN